MKLNAELLQSAFEFPGDLIVSKYRRLPEKALQFGEGNFLRAFADAMLHELNKQNLFNGQVVAVQPIPAGLAAKINEQDGLYTLILRGLENGVPKERKEIISSISRALNPYTDWESYLQCAENPDLELIISNTTEAGIAFLENDRPEDAPPASFPGKLTSFLYHRFQYFAADISKGMLILPCELIDRNGDTLKDAVLRTADNWGLSAAFSHWVKTANTFANTLVDRVVTGYPQEEADAITAHLGYADALLDTGELFHLWVIEAPPEAAIKLPFAQAGLNVIFTDDLSPYRTRKVRILNGAHTASVPAAFLAGLDSVGEMMGDEVLGKYVTKTIFEEIIPSIDLDKQMLTDFAYAVLERFQNPFIKHYLLSILLNSNSKFKARVLPSIIEYRALHGRLPERLTFSFAALIAVYQKGTILKGEMKAYRDKGEFRLKDDLPVLEFFAKVWQGYDGSRANARAVAEAVLGNEAMWGENLNKIPDLTEKTASYLYAITNGGIKKTITALT
ncbi:MAG: tagaturonate reductase [Sporomusaceae bacterium]|jgi:tagaturonate reductase|nr:tagaturonate reductase [Sporomusaceae bacterium]